MQIKIKKRYHKTPSKVAKNNADHTSVNTDMEPLELLSPLMEMYNSKSTVENSLNTYHRSQLFQF